jgi:hypothetical protein
LQGQVVGLWVAGDMLQVMGRMPFLGLLQKLTYQHQHFSTKSYILPYNKQTSPGKAFK